MVQKRAVASGDETRSAGLRIRGLRLARPKGSDNRHKTKPTAFTADKHEK